VVKYLTSTQHRKGFALLLMVDYLFVTVNMSKDGFGDRVYGARAIPSTDGNTAVSDRLVSRD
jgi:hypothetical protein